MSRYCERLAACCGDPVVKMIQVSGDKLEIAEQNIGSQVRKGGLPPLFDAQTQPGVRG